VEVFARLVIAQFNVEFCVFDVLSKEWHSARLALLYFLVDTKAIADFTDAMQYPCTVSCHMCHLVARSYAPANGRKQGMYYFGSYKHLHPNDPLRLYCAGHQFPDGPEESDSPPALRKSAEVLEAGRIGEECPFPDDSIKHSSRRLHQKKTPWPSLYVPWRHDMVCVDSGHQGTNTGVVFANTATGLGFGRVDATVVAMEEARGRFDNPETWLGERPSPPPWVMSRKESKTFMTLLHGLHVPQYHGGRVRNFLEPKVMGQMKMHDWRVVISEVGIWGLHASNSWAHDVRYRNLFTMEFQHLSDLRLRSLTESQLKRLEVKGYRIHALKEMLLPTRCLTWTSHYNTHLARFRQLLGGDVNMFRDERANRTIFNGGHSSVNLELSQIRFQALRDVVSFLAVDSPEIFGEVEPEVHDLLGGGHLLPWRFSTVRRMPEVVLKRRELEFLLDMYDGFDIDMSAALRHTGSGEQLRELRVHHTAQNIQLVDARWRKFRVAKDLQKCPWEHGQCTLEWTSLAGELRYGVIRRILRHKIYDHQLSPTAIVFEVVECPAEASSPLTVIRMNRNTVITFVLAEDVNMVTCFFLPAIEPDRQRGWTHNVVRYWG
jgi:hypothetical protein